MNLPICPCCVVVLNQQQEKNLTFQNQQQDIPVNDSKNNVKTCTVVENGRVVIKTIEPQINQS